MAPLPDSRIATLEGSVDDLESRLDSIYQNLSAGIADLDNRMANWVPPMLKAEQDIKIIKGNLEALQVGWPFRCIQGPQGEINIEQEYLNFHIIQASTTEVDVYGGTWDRNGVELTMTVTSGKTYKRLPALNSDGTWYIYLALESTTGDPSLVPATLTANASKTNPDNDYDIGTYKILGTVEVASGVIKPLGITQTWYGGNIFDFWMIPDADSNYDVSGGSKRYYSVELSPRSGLHAKTAQIYGFDDPDLAVPAATELIPFRKKTEYLPGQFFYSINWATPEQLLDNIDWGGSSGIGADIGDWLNDNTYIKHNKLNFAADTIPATAYANTDHDYRYPEPDTPTNGVDANAGIFSFTNATAASAGAGAIKVTGGIYAAKGVYGVKGAAAAAANFNNGGEVAQFCNGTDEAYFTNASSYEIFIGSVAGINVQTGSYFQGGVQGATYTASKVQLPLAGGGYWEGYIRGGILTAT